MSPERFHGILRELLDENAFAIRPFLKVARVEFSEAVPTLAVCCGEEPVLEVNLLFVARECHSDAEVKAVILHEFLHILLRHTERRGPISKAEHLATDAVINAIIHRQIGEAASSLMTHYYVDTKGIGCLLRPPLEGELPALYAPHSPLQKAWRALYEGKLVVDDIRELAEAFTPGGGRDDPEGVAGFKLDCLLGNHGDREEDLGGILAAVLGKSLRMMNGGGIWRSPHDIGIGCSSVPAEYGAERARMLLWERRVLVLLRKHLAWDRKSRMRRSDILPAILPLLSPGDRRAFARAQWSPILPLAQWDLPVERPAGSAQVYLDVSGSMNAEMPIVIGLLNRLRHWIASPFWAFSDVVKPAHIVGGKLITETTGGTSLASVLAHVARTHPEAAVIVTDGYVEKINPAWVTAARATRLHVLVTRGGSTKQLELARIPYSQLPEVPQ
jgi:hypothetical protein